MSFNSICLTETWLSKEVCNSQLFLSEYSVLRGDRDFAAVWISRGDGVLLAARETIQIIRIDMDFVGAAIPSIDYYLRQTSFLYTLLRLCLCFVYSVMDIYPRFWVAFDLLVNCDFCSKNNFIVVADFNVPLFISAPVSDRKRELLTCFQHYLSVDQLNCFPT